MAEYEMISVNFTEIDGVCVSVRALCHISSEYGIFIEM